jgi:hypothetical protein
MANWQQGDESKARSWYDKAAEWMEKYDPRDGESGRFRAEAAALLGVSYRSTPTTKKEENAKQRPKS